MNRLNARTIGEGRPLVVLHGGLLDHRHMVDTLEPAFAQRSGWRRIYVDLPGCGGSTGFAHVNSQDDVLAELATFMRHETSGAPCAVLGESRGSYLAQGLAYRHPESVAGLCLIVPGGFPTTPPPEKPEHQTLVADPALLENLTPELRRRAEGLVVQSRTIIEKIRTLKLPAVKLHDPALEARIQQNFLFSFHDDLLRSAFPHPSLILSGRQDSMSGYADTLAMLPCYPRASFALLDRAGHALAWESPALLQAHIHDWLDRMEQAG